MNVYKNLNTPKVLENFETLYESEKVLIERIVSSDKPEGKLYNQPYDEWLVLLDGEATLDVDERRVDLKKGDTLLIEKNTPHKVLQTSFGTIWLCVHIGDMKEVLNA